MAWWDDFGNWVGEATGWNAAQRAGEQTKVEQQKTAQTNQAVTAQLEAQKKLMESAGGAGIANPYAGRTPEQIAQIQAAQVARPGDVQAAQVRQPGAVTAERLTAPKDISAEGRASQNAASQAMAAQQAQFAEAQAQGEAQRAAAQAGQQAQRQARTAGLNPAQAAMLAQEQAAGAYTNTLGSAKNQASQNFAGQQGVAMGQAGQQLQASQANQGTALQSGMANQQAGNQIALANQQTALQAAAQNAQLAQQAALTNQGTALSTGTTNAQLAQQAAAQNAQIAQQNIGNQMAWTQAGVGVNQYNRNFGQQALMGAAGISGPGAGYSNTQAGGAIGQTIGAIGGAIGAFSDENLKDNIQEVGEPSEVAAEIPAVTFNYKEEAGEDPDPTRLGVLAQDLEKTPLAYTVEDTPKGKMVNTAQLTLANTAMLGDLARKLERAMKMYEEMI